MNMKNTYILNSPILTDFGEYRYSKISVEEAKTLLNGGFISAVGHQATAEVLSSLLGIQIPAQRIMVKMGVGDKALIFAMAQRLPEGKVLSRDEIEEIGYTLGLLERVR